MSPRFEVLLDDNFHHADESERRPVGTYETYEEALARARQIVAESVRACAEGNDTAAAIIASYKMFGDDPWIHPTPEGVERFSAWDFAEELARELAVGRGD